MQNLRRISKFNKLFNAQKCNIISGTVAINNLMSMQILPVATKFVDSVKHKALYCTESVNVIRFEKVCEETLESLTEYFEEIIESDSQFKDADVSYSSGVLTVNLGKSGTYVINRQSPNKQIWLSSPTSGPKRFDLMKDYWIYKHTGENLHELLQTEISKIIKIPINFAACSHSGI